MKNGPERLRCKSCGDQFLVGWPDMDRTDLSKEDIRLLKPFHQTHCITCGTELALGELNPTTLMHNAGGGHRVIRDPRGL